MTQDDIIAIVRENERMKTALKALLSLAETAVMGAWRQKVYDLARTGLGLGR